MADEVKENKKPVKLCTRCNEVKPLSEGFYRAGKSWQKYCKICHNEKRVEYKMTSSYKPKPTGFKKLPEELQKKIIYDIYVRVNFKDIWRKYKDEYPQIKHQTLLKWNRANQIPEYEPPE